MISWCAIPRTIPAAAVIFKRLEVIESATSIMFQLAGSIKERVIDNR